MKIGQLFRLQRRYRDIPGRTALRILSSGQGSVLAEFACLGRLITRNRIYWISFADLAVVAKPGRKFSGKGEVK